MNEFSPNTFYAATARTAPVRPQLSGGLETEVCIIGAGFAGLWTARALVARGHEVVLLEAGEVAGEASGRNGGFVSAGHAERLDKIVARVGLDHARALYKLSRDGVEIVRNFLGEGESGFGAKPGRLNVLRFNDEVGLIDQAETLARDFDHDVVVWSRDRVRAALRTDRYYQALHEADAFHLHPLNLARALAADIENRGGKIYEHSAVVDADLDGLRKSILTGKGRVRAFQVVLAGSAFLGKAFPQLSSTVLSVGTHVAVTEPIGDVLSEVIRYEGAISDTRRAGDYYRIVDDRLLWGGRITTNTKPPKNLARKMARDIAKIYPRLKDVSIEYAWSGTMGYAIHKMPQVGMVQPGVWIASAFGGHGLNTTAVAGDLIASAIVEQDDRWRLYIPFGLVWTGGLTGRAATQSVYWSMRLKDWFDEAQAKRTEQAQTDMAKGLSPGLAAHTARRAKRKFAQSRAGHLTAQLVESIWRLVETTKAVVTSVGRRIHAGSTAVGRGLVAIVWFVAGIIGFIAQFVGAGMDLVASAIGAVLLSIVRAYVVIWRSVVIPSAKLIAPISKWVWNYVEIAVAWSARAARVGSIWTWARIRVIAAWLGVRAQELSLWTRQRGKEAAIRSGKWLAAFAAMLWASYFIPTLKRLAEYANLAGNNTRTGSIKLLQHARRSSVSFGNWSAKQLAVIWNSWLLPVAKQVALRLKELKGPGIESEKRSSEQKIIAPPEEHKEVVEEKVEPEIGAKQPVTEEAKKAARKDLTLAVELIKKTETGSPETLSKPVKSAKKRKKPKEKSVEA